MGRSEGSGVAVFCGHGAAHIGQSAPSPADAEPVIAAAIAAVLDLHPVQHGYGSLAAGADILWAEGLLAAGAELHVILPSAPEAFLACAVAPAGAAWVERHERCLAAAADVRYAVGDAQVCDDTLVTYGAELAMGLALLAAEADGAEARQLVVWDGESAAGQLGPGAAVATWRRAGRFTVCVSPSGTVRGLGGLGAAEPGLQAPARPSLLNSSWLEPAARTDPMGGRVVHAVLTGNVPGSSELTDEQLPAYVTCVLGCIAGVIDRHPGDVLDVHTWGAGFQLVVRDARVAAALALELQCAMSAADLRSAGLPADLALALDAHVGPVVAVRDPLLKALGFTGSPVRRGTEVVALVPPGEAHVSEAFAAALALSGRAECALEPLDDAEGPDRGSRRGYRLGRPGAHATTSLRAPR